MSLNKFMHPRNKYRNQKPSFKELALEYPDFGKHTTRDEESGKVHLDFKDPSALRALTKTLLKHDFELDVDLPSDRLVPTIPLRLNYIHWIEDILDNTEGEIRGIDIGTGSSCVYPLLGCRLNRWSFLATEMDAQNAHYAQKNVENNHMENLIKVKKVSKGDILLAAVKDSSEHYHFCMCNPPFFADHLEAQAVTTSRSVDRADPFSVSTASPEESIAQGGEINFISQMIDESVGLKTQIKIFTSMVGKKSSLPQLKEKLRLTQDAIFSTTEFCQGKTMRWGVAWTFDKTVSFPKSLFHTARKEKPPLSYVIPFGAGGCLYEMADLTQYIRSLLDELQIEYKQGKVDALSSSWLVTAKDKSWQNQRRKRRQMQRTTDPQQKTNQAKPVCKQNTELPKQISEDNFATPNVFLEQKTEICKPDSEQQTEKIHKPDSEQKAEMRKPDCKQETEIPKLDCKQKTIQEDIKMNLNSKKIKEDLDQMDKSLCQPTSIRNDQISSPKTVNAVENDACKHYLETVNCDHQVNQTHPNTENLNNKNSDNSIITTNIDEAVESNQATVPQSMSAKRKQVTVHYDNAAKRLCVSTGHSKIQKNDTDDVSTSTTTTDVRSIRDKQHVKSHSKSAREKVSHKRKPKFVYSEPEVKRIHYNSDDSDCKKGKDRTEVKQGGDPTTASASGSRTVCGKHVKSSSTVRCGDPKAANDYVLKCYINLKNVEQIVLELVWVNGESREVLHQLMQYFKNKLKAPVA